MGLSLIIAIIVVWILAVVCIIIMKKLQPKSFRLYLVYVLFVVIAFTVCLCVPVFSG